ncbi:MAG TPA: response regulator [Arenimonas sp.]|nr:response regulator [Arenimonas sp.]
MSNLPRLLLIEDDAVTAAFLRESLLALPAEVKHALSFAAAEGHLASGSFELWLVDANLPDGIAEDWLPRQRQQGHRTPALALTAELFRDRLDALIAAGFIEALQKPIAMPSLHTAVQRALGHVREAGANYGDKQPLWDDEAALQALGSDHQAMAVLRAMFSQELPQQRDVVLAALRDGHVQAARDELHKLKASTAIVGAARVADAVRRLAAMPADAAMQQRFADAVSDYLADTG